MISPFAIVAKQAAILMRHVTKKTAICEGCGKEYKLIHPNSSERFCNPTCGKGECICTVCNKSFVRKIRYKTKNIFCSDNCKSKHRYTEAEKLKKPKKPQLANTKKRANK